jgi:putative heme-binding domain-containing protein
MLRWFTALLGMLFVSVSFAEDLDYHVTDPELKVVRLDSSPDASFLSVRLDTTGRIFVGGRKTLFVYDVDQSDAKSSPPAPALPGEGPGVRAGLAAAKYKPRHLLCEFPDHTWVNDIEIRGDDLFIVTVSAVYRLPGARVKRDGVQPERLLWGVPNGHVHQCFHACAWGPEGDLYVSMGDPLWYYGDFNRPDHWGHWTMFFKPTVEQAARLLNSEDEKPEDKKNPSPRPSPRKAGARGQETVRVGDKDWATMPYNGVGAVFRIRPDGTDLRSFSRGLRNPCGLCFDKNWNLFTNDNDHEGLPSMYAPGRLLHVTEGSYFSWPRGWLQSKTPDRADILPAVNDEMGRAVPVLQTYYADGYLPAKYENSLMVARWGRRQVSYFPLEAKGNTIESREFTAKENVLMEGRDQARPVGVCVGRGGRVFVTICYMPQNEGSPTYRSDLAVITRKDDPDTMPFEGFEATAADVSRLQDEFKADRWPRNAVAKLELQRRGQQLFKNEQDQTAFIESRSLSVGSLAEQMGVWVSRDVPEMRNRLRTYLRQLIAKGHMRALQQACLRLAQYDDIDMRERLCKSSEARDRLAGVLAVGFRLTIPCVDAKLPDDAPLAPQQKEEANVILFADEKEPIDLRKFGRVGNYTVAEHWKALKHTDEQEQLFALLMERLDDNDDKVRLQAAHFLSLLNDPRSEPKIAAVTANVQDKRLNLAKLEHLKPQVWMLGPVPDDAALRRMDAPSVRDSSETGGTKKKPQHEKDSDGRGVHPTGGFNTIHAVETTAIDLAAKYEAAGKSFEWTLTKTTSPDRPLYDFHALFGPSPNSSVYSFFRFDAPTAQRMQLLVGSEDGVKIWQNGKLVFENDVVRPLIQLDDVVPLDLQPGSNDILVRVRMRAGLGGEYFHFKHLGDVRLSIPDKPDGLSLADRLKSAGTGTQPIDPKFLEVDWPEAVKSGDVARGKKLFAAESLGCAKCHAATATQAGGGGPSLTDAGKRFTVPYLVESVLAPSKVISPVFKSSVITTTDGKVITGLIVTETADKLEILQPDTKRVTINKSDIDERKLADVSAMPPGVVKTVDELRDVLAYLLSNPEEERP